MLDTPTTLEYTDSAAVSIDGEDEAKQIRYMCTSSSPSPTVVAFATIELGLNVLTNVH